MTKKRIGRWFSYLMLAGATACVAQSDGWLIVQRQPDGSQRCWKIPTAYVNWEHGQVWWRLADDSIVFVSGSLLGAQVVNSDWQDAARRCGLANGVVCQ